MQYLLIKSCHFEVSALGLNLRMTSSSKEMLELMQKVPRIKLAYIRVMRSDYWDTAQSIERNM